MVDLSILMDSHSKEFLFEYYINLPELSLKHLDPPVLLYFDEERYLLSILYKLLLLYLDAIFFLYVNILNLLQ